MEGDAQRIERSWASEPDVVAGCPAGDCPPVGAHLSIGRDDQGLPVGVWSGGTIPLYEQYVRETDTYVSRDGVKGTITRIRPVRPSLRHEAWILYLRLDTSV